MSTVHEHALGGFFRALNRRGFLRRVGGLVLLLTGAWILKRVFLPRRLTPPEVDSFSAFLDTLVPDGQWPGARRTLAGNNLVNEVRATRQGRRALVEGIERLDRRAREDGAASFADLPYEQRERIVAEFQNADEGSLPRFFYRSVRDRVMELHYASPAARQSLGLPNAPQPHGYPDYWQKRDG